VLTGSFWYNLKATHLASGKRQLLPGVSQAFPPAAQFPAPQVMSAMAEESTEEAELSFLETSRTSFTS
jgi:hypothetical protein